MHDDRPIKNIQLNFCRLKMERMYKMISSMDFFGQVDTICYIERETFGCRGKKLINDCVLWERCWKLLTAICMIIGWMPYDQSWELESLERKYYCAMRQKHFLTWKSKHAWLRPSVWVIRHSFLVIVLTILLFFANKNQRRA